jgi:hypothetical protein
VRTFDPVNVNGVVFAKKWISPTLSRVTRVRDENKIRIGFARMHSIEFDSEEEEGNKRHGDAPPMTLLITKPDFESNNRPSIQQY